MTVYYFKRHNKWTFEGLTGQNFSLFEITKIGVTVKSTRCDALRTHLEKEGVGTLIHYPIPLYSQAAYKEMNNLKENYPISNAIAEQILSLPMGPHFSKREVEYVCEEVDRFFQR